MIAFIWMIVIWTVFMSLAGEEK